MKNETENMQKANESNDMQINDEAIDFESITKAFIRTKEEEVQKTWSKQTCNWFL